MKSAGAAAATAEADEEAGPTRRCIVTGDRLVKERMIRCVVDPEGVVVPDVAAALPGRGLWLTSRRDIVALAIKKRCFDRAARRKVRVPDDLSDRIEMLLAARCRDAIGLARRAGRAVAGFEKVRGALRAEPAGVVLSASDGAADGRRKIAAVAFGVPVLSALTAAELGVAFGREHIVHAVVGPGPLAERLRIDAGRLSGFRGVNTAPDTGASDIV